MKKVIKVILLVAIAIVILTPSFVLAFQLARTSPEVYMGETEVNPAFVSWSVINSDGEEVITSLSQARAEKKFQRAEKMVVTMDQIKQLTFPRSYLGCAVSVYALQETEHSYPKNITFDSFKMLNIAVVEPLQVTIVVLWEITEGVRVKAAYSFEVHPL